MHRVWSRFWQGVQTPAASLLLLIGLTVCGLALETSPLGRSTIGRFVGRKLFAMPRAQPGGTAGALALHDSQGVFLLGLNGENSDRLDGMDGSAYVGWSFGSKKSGLFGLTAETYRFRIQVLPDSNTGRHSWTITELAQARQLFISEIRDRGYVLDASILSFGDISVTRALWSGYLHNAATVVCLVLFIASLAWVPRHLVMSRRRKRLSSELCPRCEYTLAGLREPICPECGERFLDR